MSMAARQKPSVLKSKALIIRLAEKMKATVHEYIARIRQRIKLSWVATAMARPIADEEPVRIAIVVSPCMSEPSGAAWNVIQRSWVFRRRSTFPCLLVSNREVGEGDFLLRKEPRWGN